MNQEQAEKLYNIALSYADLQGNETVIDAYCGTGTISLYLAQKAKHVIGIEIIPAAIENAEKNHVKNVEFHAADYLSQAAKKGKSADIIVLDPIRAGCSEKVIDAISEIKPKKIVYISCNVSTLARDIERLTQKGYTLQKVQPVDMLLETMYHDSIVQITNYAVLLTDMGQPDIGLSALRKLCRVIREYNSDTGLDYASVQEAMGGICLTMGEVQQATSHFQKAMEIYETVFEFEPDMIETKKQEQLRTYTQAGVYLGQNL